MDLAWWKRGAIYQIYPRSFADSDGDGVGDLAGIAARLDHLGDLGVEAIWLSPFYPSPMADFGYDVADYCDVDPVFGTLADFDRLLDACHGRGIKVVIDWVPNHTSDRHPWFAASRSSRDDPKRDWYVWRDAAPGGGPPNDWESAFKECGAAWTFDERTGQYYLHSFMPQQPDLDWDNPEVEAAMHDTLRFWLDRGVDGFRIDVVMKLAKDPRLRSNAGATRRHDEDWDSIHERLRRIRAVVDSYDDRMLVGEVYLLDLNRVVSYVNSGDELHLAHNFVFLQLPWSAAAYRTSIGQFDALASAAAWPAWFLANHDHSRVASRFGPVQARAVGLMLYALRGTPFVYQGEELGLPDAVIGPERKVDVDGRDPERAPIPWRPGPGAGFTTGTPWLPFVDDVERLNVETQGGDPRSTLNLFRRLAALRAATPALQSGAQAMVDAGPDVLVWTRAEGDRSGARPTVGECSGASAGRAPLYLVAINFADEPRSLEATGTLLLSTDPDRVDGKVEGRLTLAPAEGVLIRR